MPLNQKHFRSKVSANRKGVLYTLSLTLLLCCGVFVFILYQNFSYTQSYLSDYIKRQETEAAGYAAQALRLFDSGESVSPEAAGALFQSFKTSASRYGFFVADGKILFFRDAEFSKKYAGVTTDELVSSFQMGGGKNTAVFTELLNGRQNGTVRFSPSQNQGNMQVSASFFEVDGKACAVGIFTNENYLLNAVRLNRHNTYAILFAALVSAVFLSVALFFSLALYRRNRALGAREREIQEKDRLIEKLNAELMKKAPVSPDEETALESAEIQFSEYKFKFYLNATHSIHVNGERGQIHPHTWEISLDTVKVREDFVQFHDIEKAAEKLLEDYQDSYLNEFEPFNVMNPILENICTYFKERFEKLLSQNGWLLLRIEISETPTRSYIIDMTQDLTPQAVPQRQDRVVILRG